MAVQTIRRKVDPDQYADMASGDRSFVICQPAEDVQTDDYFVFVEEVEGQDNREIYRKVSIVVEIEGHDIVIAGLVPVEYQSLESIFSRNNTLMAYGLEKRGAVVTLLQEPCFIPVLAAPSVDANQINDAVGVQAWPDGQYSIMLKCDATPVEDGRQDVTITETLIMCRTTRQVGEDTVDVFLSADPRFLQAGKLKDEFGNEIQPSFAAPEPEPEEYYFDEAEEAAEYGYQEDQDDHYDTNSELDQAPVGGTLEDDDKSGF